MNDRELRIKELYRRRPRNLFLRLNLLGSLVLLIVSWTVLDVPWSELFTSQRRESVRRFLTDVYPFALRGEPFRLRAVGAWSGSIWREKGRGATLTTLGISVAAILLASGLALPLIFPASRNLAAPEPFLPAARPPSWSRRILWMASVGASRGLFIVARALPEYVWAFLLVAMLGPSVWPAILALAIHNFGILGRLGAEVVEGVDPAAPRALRAQGMTRSQIAWVGVAPACLGKWWLFFFYRWETCVREATVLGMLGIASLGFWIRDARARDWYDEMVLYVLMGSALVLVGDLTSAIVRRYLRRA